MIEPIIVRSFSGSQADMDEVYAFHLMVRQWQVDTNNHIFSNFFESKEDLPHINDYYIRDNGNFFVARTAGTDKLVGIVGLRDDGDGQGVLKRLAVHPDYHRQKIASKLVDELLQWARDHNFQKIRLATGETEKAKGLYERVGFVVVGRAPRNNDYLMELDVT